MITIVIPVHNRRALTQQCLGCLDVQTYRNFRVIVVDDGSTDGTSQMIQDEFPDTLIIRGTGDLWWTEATNWGIRYAQEHPAPGFEEHFILTLNDDTQVRPDYLQTLLDAYEQHKPCLVGSPSVDVDDPKKLEFAGTHMELWFASGRHAAADYNYDYDELARRTDFVESDSLPGRGTLIPMAVFDKVGLYDSRRFSHYMSDIEFSVRAKKAGYKLIVNTKSLVLEYTKATGLFLKEKETWKDFVNSFTSVRSPTNLTVRYNFAIAHGKTKQLYFLVDVLRISMGFLKRKYLMAK
ncbi:glycosyltransferase family 2 protein [Fibrella aquatilis]|uniref:Glycosyltransferase family 2 protein n=1 Tax=Fibrella aquatilis TaxID=2817059 RepID=A0A939K041_9BACT|nr:glycosyltransferase family 2 protein [Fibrella aquatilis]MBO0932078.1 glycosyltransferase family 2 protein [Fibrella aquatilis]